MIAGLGAPKASARTLDRGHGPSTDAGEAVENSLQAAVEHIGGPVPPPPGGGEVTEKCHLIVDIRFCAH